MYCKVSNILNYIRIREIHSGIILSAYILHFPEVMYSEEFSIVNTFHSSRQVSPVHLQMSSVGLFGKELNGNIETNAKLLHYEKFPVGSGVAVISTS